MSGVRVGNNDNDRSGINDLMKTISRSSDSLGGVTYHWSQSY
jgi:hypothetical protein